MVNINFVKGLKKNKNITQQDIQLIASVVSNIESFFNKVGVDIPYENSLEIFKNIKLYSNYDFSDEKLVEYDEKENTILQNFYVDSSLDVKKYEYEYTKCFLNLLTKKQVSKNRMSKGLEVSTAMKVVGTRLNEMLTSYIATLITGYKSEEEIDKLYTDKSGDYLTQNDILLKDYFEIFGVNQVLESYISSNGNDIYDKVSLSIGEDDAFNLYSSIDNYPNGTIKNRSIYDENILKLKENMLEVIPKM